MAALPSRAIDPIELDWKTRAIALTLFSHWNPLPLRSLSKQPCFIGVDPRGAQGFSVMLESVNRNPRTGPRGMAFSHSPQPLSATDEFSVGNHLEQASFYQSDRCGLCKWTPRSAVRWGRPVFAISRALSMTKENRNRSHRTLPSVRRQLSS
jgi:hypothetical protein